MEYTHRITKHFIERNLPFQLESFDDESIEQKDLIHDLDNIDDEYAKSLSENKPKNWSMLLRLSKDDEFLTWKKYILLKEIEKEVKPVFINTIEKCRDNRVKPYDESDLNDLEVDEDCLVNLSEFKEYSTKHNIENKYSICLPIRDAMLYERICWSFLNLNDKHQIRIRLDPLLRYPEFTGHFERFYGQILNWEELSRIQNEYPCDYRDYKTRIKTEILWKKTDDSKLQFFCEELPLYEQINEIGSRFYHAIYDIETKMITHLDASTIIYSESQFLERNSLKLWNLDSHKGKYCKIYRVYGDVDREAFVSLVSWYFVRNKDVERHFNELNSKIKDYKDY